MGTAPPPTRFPFRAQTHNGRTPRPAPGARSVQPKTPQLPAGPRIIQRYVWGVLDTEDSNNQIVTGNVTRFTAQGTGRDTLPKSTDTNVTQGQLQQVGIGGGVLHLHGHGREDGFALMSAQTFAQKTIEKFGENALRGRVIVFHSCEVGQQNYLGDYLRALKGNGSGGSWSGTMVFGPTRFLGVNHDGISLVSKAGVTEKQMQGVSDYFSNLMERKARAWRVAYVQGGAVLQEDVTVGSEKYRILKDALSRKG
jgi:hypothetical protein